ncbi:MAG: hypothetical protein AB1595_06030 [bacterium]
MTKLIFSFLLFFSVYLFPSLAFCKDCPPDEPPKDQCDISQPPPLPPPGAGVGGGGGNGNGGPNCGPPPPPPPPPPIPPDHPDDTVDVSDSAPSLYPSPIAEIAILMDGHWKDLGSLLQRLNIPYAIHRDIPELDDHSIFIIPSGGLMGRRNSPLFKQALEGYANQGGTIICFSQQYGEDFQTLPGNLSGYGWLEDQSCYSNEE